MKRDSFSSTMVTTTILTVFVSVIIYCKTAVTQSTEDIICNTFCVREEDANHNLMFPETIVGSLAIPEELCLKEDYSPVSKKCEDCGIWGKIDGDCKQQNIDNSTSTLYDFLKNDDLNNLDKTRKVIKSCETVRPMDLILVAKLLEKSSKNPGVADYADDFLDLIDVLLDLEQGELEQAQPWNCTDQILDSLEMFFMKQPTKIPSKKRLLDYTVTTNNEIVGARIEHFDTSNLKKFSATSLYTQNASILEYNRDYEVGFTTAYKGRIDFSLFQNSNLFPSKASATNSWIIGLFREQKKMSLRVHFKQIEKLGTNLSEHCAHWEYGVNKKNNAISGSWKFDNEVTKDNGVNVCQFSTEATYFTVLRSVKEEKAVTVDIIEDTSEATFTPTPLPLTDDTTTSITETSTEYAAETVSGRTEPFTTEFTTASTTESTTASTTDHTTKDHTAVPTTPEFTKEDSTTSRTEPTTLLSTQFSTETSSVFTTESTTESITEPTTESTSEISATSILSTKWTTAFGIITTVMTTESDPTTPSDLQPKFFFCPEETINNITFPKTIENTWAIPKTICLEQNYTSIRRKCEALGVWEKFTGQCNYTLETVTTTTQNLYNLTQTTPEIAINEVVAILETSKEISEIDIHLVSDILETASKSVNVSENFTATINSVIGMGKNLLASSQDTLNSTDRILSSLDEFLLSNSSNKINTRLPNLFIRSISHGIGAIFRTGTSSFSSINMEVLTKDKYQNQLDSSFEMAFLLNSPIQNPLFATLFINDHLFNENTEKEVDGFIISLLIPDLPKNTTIQLFFKENKLNMSKTCNHWNYGYEQRLPIFGTWKYDDDFKTFKDNIFLCTVNHTTHFGMLISDGTVPEDFVLDLLTIFGVALSIIGLSIIFLTAAVFKTWSANPSNKIILNLSVCLLFTIIFFFISDLTSNGTFCIIVGIVLHYLVLSQFCWALVISYSNYRRLYLGLHYHISNVVLKYCTFSWGAPIPIVAIVAGLNIHIYEKTSAIKFCYPKTSYFTFGVLCPIAIILVANSIIYVFIVKKLATTTFNIRKHKKNTSCTIGKPIFLMVFVMGLTWIFGILASVIPDSMVFSYLFSTTATCHGFVIFVFYILDSPNTRQLWLEKLRQLLKIKDKKVPTSKTNSTNIGDSLTD